MTELDTECIFTGVPEVQKKNHFPKIIILLLTSADLRWGVVKGKNGKKLMATQFRD